MLELRFYKTISSLLFFCVGLHAAAVDNEMKLLRGELLEMKLLREELLEIRSSYKILVRRMDELEKTNAVLQKCDVVDSEHSNQSVVSNQIKRLSASDIVAFRAYVSDPISNVGDNQIIPFRTVQFDSHRAFHGDSGVFTSPKSGLYAFFCTFLVYQGQSLDFEIVKDGHVLAYGGSYGNKAEHDYGSRTTSTLLHLNAGDKMYVRVHGNHHSSTGNTIYPSFSHFMGFSLY
ncbi:unnamed protein product [Mytilus edulis]|uniref:C1q domain-containing protein n=1 Tax=Mytilus edulis TaxID=6550 RepID=A0A8S3V2R0_MYTED|nr:unnamed protein product [Mytilus edulis]